MLSVAFYRKQGQSLGVRSARCTDARYDLSVKGVRESPIFGMPDARNPHRPMSGLGHKRKSSVGLGMSAFGGKAEVNFGRLKVRS